MKIVLAGLLLAAGLHAQFRLANGLIPPILTVATLPAAASSTNSTVIVTDSSTGCTVGGGTTILWCYSNGTSWVAISGTGGAGSLTVNVNTVLVGTAATLNFNAGSGITLSGVFGSSINNVQITADTAVIQSKANLQSATAPFICVDDGTSGGTAYKFACATSLGAYAANQIMFLRVVTTSGSTTPTANIDTLGNKTITDSLAAALATTTTLQSGAEYPAWYDGTHIRIMTLPFGTGGGGITALTGDATASGSGSVALTLATVNSSIGTCGDATHVGQATYNAKGLTTACTPVLITGTSLYLAAAGPSAGISTPPSSCGSEPCGTDTVIFDSGALTALPSGGCYDINIRTSVTTTTSGDNWTLWFGTAAATGGSLTLYTSTNLGPWHFWASICNLAGSQTSQTAVWEEVEANGVGLATKGNSTTMSQTTTGNTLHISLTNATNNGSAVTTTTTPIHFTVALGQ